MRILFCNYEYPPLGGGGGMVMKELAQALAARGHDVTVLTSQALGLCAHEVQQGVNIIRTPVFFRRQFAVANFASMAAYLPMGIARGLSFAPGSFDVVNTHFVLPSGPVGHLIARTLKVPNVLTVHGGDLFDPSKRSFPHRHAWLRGPVRWLLRAADVVVGQSHNTLRHLKNIYHVARPVELIPLGITPPPRRLATTRSMLGLPQDAFVVATVGRLVPRKSTADLIRVVAACGQPDLHLLIVGDGPELADLRRLTAEMNLAGRVHCVGHLSEERKFAALALADVFASCSQHEGFGLVFLEAMASGLPVVCYDYGGQTDFLENGLTGRLVRLNDLAGMARALRELRLDTETRARIARNNCRMVEKFFIDHCAERYETLLRCTLERSRPQWRPAAAAGSAQGARE